MSNNPNHLKVLLPLLFVCLSGSFDPSRASAVGTITEVKLSPDGGRLVIQVDGPFDEHRVSTASDPNRIIIELDGARTSSGVRIEKPPRRDVRDIKVGMTDRGSTVVIYFGANPVPEYRVVRIRDAVLIMLEDSAQSDAAGPIGQPDPSASPRMKPPEPLSQPRSELTSQGPQGPSGLVVKSCQVINGVLVIDVADHNSPRPTHRIELELDLARLGFKAANIERLDGTSASPVSRPRQTKKAGNSEKNRKLARQAVSIKNHAKNLSQRSSMPK